MANKVTIDVEARFIDNVTKQADSASSSFDKLEKEAKGAAKEVDTLGKKKATPKLDADSSKLLGKLDKTESRLKKLGRSKTEAKLSMMDKATAVIDKVMNKAKAFGNKTYSGLVKIRDSNVLSTLNKMSGGLKNLTGKAWSVAVKVKDLATAPLRGIKNMLFSIKSLVLAITAGLAAKQLIMNPINVADAYSSAKISFSTLLGESQGQQMMDQLDEFAKATPFNTTNVISNAQKMLAMGWDAENIIEDMEVIGNAAAATGKLDVGLESIVRALSQIKTKGRLSTEELNQLAEAGISAKAMLAENLGYGTGDEGIAKMTEDLEDGAIASNVAIEALLAGMRKYDGMMDSMANETVEGLWSQMQDAFSINIVRKWGQGLQDGARRGFGSIVSLLDEAEAALSEFGDTLYEVGKTVSNWAADKLENTIKRITDITGSFEFKNANLKEKISMLWNGVVVDPLREWWEGGGREKTAETAGEIGAWMGKTITSGLLAIFGMTDILDEETASKLGESGGMSIAQSFAKGFTDNFDGSAITDALVDAISDVWGALPTWAKILIGGYGIGKAAGGISSLAGGVTNLIGGVGNVIGSSSQMTGLMGAGANTAIALGAGNLAGGASLGGTALSLLGLGATAGGLAAGASVIKGGYDFYNSYKSFKAGDKLEGEASATSAGMTLGGVAGGAMIGAAIGSLVPVIGTAVGGLIGAGIGGIAGWIGGDKKADEIRAAAYESQAMKDAIADGEKSAEELSAIFEKAKWENAKKHFGDIKLSMSEIARIADQIVWGDDMAYFEQFTTAAQTAEASLKSMKGAAETSNRWMWKASLGVTFNEDEVESITESFDEYINAAISFAENKHYEFTAAVGLLVDVESEGGKGILESGNAFYGKVKADIEAAGTELGDALTKALADGFINAEEQEAITAAQQKIASITEKIANAESHAELDLIKVKFGSGNLDSDSFDNFMAQMQTTIDARMSAMDEAFVASISSLNLQLAEGAITQEEYDKQVQAILDGYNTKTSTLRADIKNVELKIIGEAYTKELGANAVEDLNNVLQHAVNEGIKPIEIDDKTMANLLNIQLEGNAETIGNIRDWLNEIATQLDLIADQELPDSVEKTVGVDITGEKHIQDTIDVLVEDFEIPEEKAATVALLLTGDKEILSKIDTSELAKELGVPKDVTETIITKLTGAKSIEERVSVLGTDLVDATEVWQTITVNLTSKVGQVVDKVSGFVSSVFGGGTSSSVGVSSRYRGGIVGGDSSMDAFARGGQTDISGIVGGSTRFIKVNEEAPEMVIPLSSQRRDRALDLWAKTGELLDVPGFARGGSTDGSQDEGIRFNAYGNSDSAGGRTIQINMGGIKLEINVSGSDKESIVEAIKAQAGDLADYIVGVIADSLETEFENTPVRGGAV